jgi:hypothetical protein
VVETYENAPSHLGVALELLALSRLTERANRIRAILASAEDSDLGAQVLRSHHLEDLLLALLDIRASIPNDLTDGDGRVYPEGLAELRQNTQLLDFDADRGALAVCGVAEGLSRVDAVTNMIREAIERGLDVAID